MPFIMFLLFGILTLIIVYWQDNPNSPPNKKRSEAYKKEYDEREQWKKQFKGDWIVRSERRDGKKMYVVLRLKDICYPDYEGNNEIHHTGYMESRQLAERIANNANKRRRN